jgi:hypothetical protein
MTQAPDPSFKIGCAFEYPVLELIPFGWVQSYSVIKNSYHEYVFS